MYDTLVERLERESHAFVQLLDRDPLVGAIISGDASRAQYVRFLAGTYHYVRWSAVLLAKTAEGLARARRSSALARLLGQKAAEEAPHDRWILSDLERCGEDLERVRSEPRPRAVTAYLEFGLALAEAGSPAYLGAAYTLEFISMQRARAAAEHLRERGAITGIERALSFLEGHGDADHGHVATLCAHLDAIDEPGERAAIEGAAAVTRALYPCFFGGRTPNGSTPARFSAAPHV